MERRTNRRGKTEHFVTGQHLKLDDLKRVAQALGVENQYLFKENIPQFPKPEFHVSHLIHDTDRKGLRGIKRDSGFRDPGGFRGPGDDSPNLVWLSLALGPDDMTSAETRLLERTCPDQTLEQAQNQESFLVQLRRGSWRGIRRFCSGAQPVMRVFETILYKQEVMYAVLVHSPANQSFLEYPLLSDNPNAVCVYRDGCFIWRPEAMCETHRYELIQMHQENLMGVRELSERIQQFYVWDHVAIALHVEEGKVLKFADGRLRENLTFCREGPAAYKKDAFPHDPDLVEQLWPDYPGPLMETRSLAESAPREPAFRD
uniref:uncharacterized protein LOC109974216 n=1 Tax=Monopterus albus TaxID=43700 RepID=UPI0009B3DE59|nr:uncharacterized protein LOC109974216 [Monopterus albus]